MINFFWPKSENMSTHEPHTYTPISYIHRKKDNESSEKLRFTLPIIGAEESATFLSHGFSDLMAALLKISTSWGLILICRIQIWEIHDMFNGDNITKHMQLIFNVNDKIEILFWIFLLLDSQQIYYLVYIKFVLNTIFRFSLPYWFPKNIEFKPQLSRLHEKSPKQVLIVGLLGFNITFKHLRSYHDVAYL